MDDVEVEEARIGDLPQVKLVEDACFGREAYPYHALAELMLSFGHLFLVAKLNGRVVGYVSATLVGGHGHIVSIAVLPEHWGRGIGSRLLGEVLRRLEDGGAKRVFLEVRVDNHRAIRLYRKFGFRVAGVKRRYYLDGSDALVMVLELREGELSDQKPHHRFSQGVQTSS